MKIPNRCSIDKFIEWNSLGVENKKNKKNQQIMQANAFPSSIELGAKSINNISLETIWSAF